MVVTRDLITKTKDILADAVSAINIQVGAEISFETVEQLAEEIGAEKIPVRTFNLVGWCFTKGEQIIELGEKRDLGEHRYFFVDIDQAMLDFKATYG